MAGDIWISQTRAWMVAGWAFQSVLESALKHVPDSASSVGRMLDNRIKGVNYIDLQTDCTTAEASMLLEALRKGYEDTRLAGPDSFGDPSFFPSYMEKFAELIRLIQEELDSRAGGTQHR